MCSVSLSKSAQYNIQNAIVKQEYRTKRKKMLQRNASGPCQVRYLDGHYLAFFTLRITDVTRSVSAVYRLGGVPRMPISAKF